MDLFKPLAPVIPVFILIAIAFVFARFRKIDLASITEIVVYLGTPSLVFSSLAGKPLFLNDIVILLTGILVIFAFVGLLIKGYFLVFDFSSRGFALPALFMNAGNMGIPLALFAFGQAGMQRATLLFVMVTFLQYTLGIYLLNGRGNWKETFRLPLIYATVAGLAVNLAQIKIPDLLLQPFSLLGQAAIPMMLISLGYRLHDVQSLKWGPCARRRHCQNLRRLRGGFFRHVSGRR